MVFHWLFIPWLQAKLDDFVDSYNHTSKRKDKNSILPQGKPALIAEDPSGYGTVDFKVSIVSH